MWIFVPHLFTLLSDLSMACMNRRYDGSNWFSNRYGKQSGEKKNEEQRKLKTNSLEKAEMVQMTERSKRHN